ncbi:hypothetical protein GCM10010347_33360 [Streptomyces cirratus]|uniref:Uncharacterized protein n=1 Tax=Streptomyces cirratus TaxID=68187 RepID=A0ABQ3ETK5_9ACTN|nr:hypothetical protein [Streptomyces cirratus]GHB60634.1 hypothetical protein GCM10010347_33360 [Streptomyces cirratus]
MTTKQAKLKPGAAEEAATELRDALAGAGIVLPSLDSDFASPYLNLVELGRIRADVAVKLAEVVRRGTA